MRRDALMEKYRTRSGYETSHSGDENITKEFPGVKALSDVSFRVAEGEIHCLVGENGAGKSNAHEGLKRGLSVWLV